jgi:uncharacterized protein (TIGR00106 family)
MAVMEISVIPIGTKTASISEFVAEAIRIIEDSGLKYELGAMGTVVEGELDQLLKLIGEIHRSVLNSGAPRVVTTIKIDERKDKPLSLEGKVKSVRQKLLSKGEQKPDRGRRA